LGAGTGLFTIIATQRSLWKDAAEVNAAQNCSHVHMQLCIHMRLLSCFVRVGVCVYTCL